MLEIFGSAMAVVANTMVASQLTFAILRFAPDRRPVRSPGPTIALGRSRVGAGGSPFCRPPVPPDRRASGAGTVRLYASVSAHSASVLDLSTRGSWRLAQPMAMACDVGEQKVDIDAETTGVRESRTPVIGIEPRALIESAIDGPDLLYRSTLTSPTCCSFGPGLSPQLPRGRVLPATHARRELRYLSP